MTGAMVTVVTYPTRRKQEHIMHTNINQVQLVVAGQRRMSRTATFLHWTMIVLTAGLWLPVYWIHRARTSRVRF